MGIGRPEESGVPDLNVIGQIDLHRTLDPLLIDAGEVVAGPVDRPSSDSKGFYGSKTKSDYDLRLPPQEAFRVRAIGLGRTFHLDTDNRCRSS